MSIKCIVVDDEPLARQVIVSYISTYPNLSLVSECSSAIEAIELLQDQVVDLMFLDINMPGFNGIALAESLENPPNIIFTTAYEQYALKGFELNAVDYLLKPIAFPRFAKAIQKLISRDVIIKLPEEIKGYLSLKVDKKLYRLPYSQISYVQAAGDYVKVHTHNKCLVAAYTLKYLEKKLPTTYFQRIHKSYIVALANISFLEGNRIKVGEDFLPVGAAYRDKLVASFNN